MKRGTRQQVLHEASAPRSKIWKDGTTEPRTWSTAYTDVAPGSALTGAGTLPIYSQVLARFTGTFPFVFTCDDLSIASPGGGGGADTTAPTVPTSLSAAANGPNRVDLARTASTDAVGVQGYRIYRGGTLIATTASTTFANTGLTAGTIRRLENDAPFLVNHPNAGGLDLLRDLDAARKLCGEQGRKDPLSIDRQRSESVRRIQA